jgi:dihydrofolate synthase / folylpolyglutamate synthase
MRFASLPEWLAWLETCHPRAIDLGLERVSRVGQQLGLAVEGGGTRRFAHKIVTVGGTNGKGSCVATLESLLLARQLKVGAYTSPHLVRYNERVRVNGAEVSDAQLCAAFAAVDAARGDISLTYFEFGTLAAFELFAAAGLDVAILEVGLGGRLDAVNIVAPDIAVITSIDLDHLDWLGTTREAIAREKAGILRNGITCVCAEINPPATLLSAFDNLHATTLLRDRDFGCSVASGRLSLYVTALSGAVAESGAAAESGAVADAKCVSANAQRIDVEGLPQPALPLPSVAAALQAAVLLRDITPIGWIEDRQFLTDLMRRLRLTGRCQHFDVNGVDVVVDVAHNPAGAAFLAQHLQFSPVSGKTLAVFTMLADKDLAAAIRATKSQISAWFIAELPGVARARAASAVAQVLTDEGAQMISVDENLRQAYNRARDLAHPGDRIVVFGSFHVAGELLPVIVTEQVDDNDQA